MSRAPRGILRLALAAALAAGLRTSAAAALSFDDVAPILRERCVICHSGEGAPRDLRLDTLENLRRGSSRGPVVAAGDPQGSELVRRIRGTSQPRMPLNGPPYLSEIEAGTVEGWIAAGMPQGRAGAQAPPAKPATLPAPGGHVTFASVQPIFLKRCASCHSRDGRMGTPPEGLRLTAVKEVLSGGERAVVVPGSPGSSELVRRVNGQSHPRMPYDGPPYLSDAEVRLITEWVAAGARDAAGAAAPIPAGRRVRLHGTLTGQWSLDGTPLAAGPELRVRDPIPAGSFVRAEGVVEANGRIRLTEIRRRSGGPDDRGGAGVDEGEDHRGRGRNRRGGRD